MAWVCVKGQSQDVEGGRRNFRDIPGALVESSQIASRSSPFPIQYCSTGMEDLASDV